MTVSSGAPVRVGYHHPYVGLRPSRTSTSLQREREGESKRERQEGVKQRERERDRLHATKAMSPYYKQPAEPNEHTHKTGCTTPTCPRNRTPARARKRASVSSSLTPISPNAAVVISYLCVRPCVHACVHACVRARAPIRPLLLSHRREASVAKVRQTGGDRGPCIKGKARAQFRTPKKSPPHGAK